MNAARRSKKSHFIGTWIALAIVLAGGAYAYFVEYEGGKKKEDQKQKDAIALRFEAEKATRIEIVSKARKIVLEKEKDVWRLAEPVKDLADAASVNNLLSTLASEKAIETVAEGEDANPEKYGLLDPTGTISVKTADGKALEIKIGAKSFDSNLYAQVGGEKKVILVTSMWDLNIAKQPKDLRDKRLLRADSTADFDSISIVAQKGGAKTTTKLKKTDGKWAFAEPKSAAFPPSAESVQAFLDQAKALRAQEFPAEDKSDTAVLKKAGLGAPILTVEMNAGDKAPWKLQVGAPPSDKGKPADASALLAAISSDVPALTQIQKSSADGLSKTPDDFYDRRAPFRFEPSLAKQASITTPQVSLSVKKSGDSWVLEGSERIAAEGKELDPAKVADLAAKLSAMRVDRFLKTEKPKGLQPAKNRIVFRDEKGEPLIDFAWGESFKVSDVAAAVPHDEFHGSPPPKAEKHEYFAESRAKGERALPAFGVLVADVDALPVKDLLKQKPAPTGAKATSSAASPVPSPGSAKPEELAPASGEPPKPDAKKP